MCIRDRYYEKALKIYREINLENENTALTYYNLGTTFDEPDKQHDCYLQSIRIYEKLGVKTIQLANAHYNIAAMSRNSGNELNALKHAKISYNLHKELLGAKHKSTKDIANEFKLK
eukprot:TRINITY_DN8174_c0_g1_i2.p1 TRINITY_DN8174_c0_g1~~TRINITY_DN8174_c0_g1_i2.p1  ORF type:complete len:116 (-),score=29.38 TRINITY_DN8174_c0_g1_i2:116-463(-)